MSQVLYINYQNGEHTVIETNKTLAELLPKMISDPRGLSSYSIGLNPVLNYGNEQPVKAEEIKNKNKPVKAPIITGESLRDFCKANDMEYLLEDWAEEENLPYTPDNIKPKSGRKVTWICRNCGNRWDAPPATRTGGSKCRRCKQ